MKWKVTEGREIRLSLRYKRQRFEEDAERWKDKEEILSWIEYQEEITDNFRINVRYRFTRREYTSNPDEPLAVKKGISIGMRYQFK